jgi:hypothetical protein
MINASEPAVRKVDEFGDLVDRGTLRRITVAADRALATAACLLAIFSTVRL